MTDYLIYGVDRNGSQTQLAFTTSARAAKTYRDKESGAWEKILVSVADSELTRAELDRRSALEDRLGKRY